MTYDLDSGKIIMFGGFDPYRGLFLRDTWTFDGVTWTQLTIPAPPPRSNAQMAYDSVTHKVVLFGGDNARIEVLGDNR
jgi:hypothetical protein